MKRLGLVLGLAGIAGVACGNDDGGPVLDPPGDTCPEPTFTGVHAVLSAPRCANSACHAGAGAPNSGSLDLSGTSTAVHQRLVGASTHDPEGSTQYPLRVEAGMPEASYLLHMVANDSPLGSSLGRMPPSGRLLECEIEAIRQWIANGALND